MEMLDLTVSYCAEIVTFVAQYSTLAFIQSVHHIVPLDFISVKAIKEVLLMIKVQRVSSEVLVLQVYDLDLDSKAFALKVGVVLHSKHLKSKQQIDCVI